MAKTENHNDSQYPLFAGDNGVFDPDCESLWAEHLVYKVFLAGSRFQLKPPPKNKAYAIALVREAMSTLHRKRRRWLPLLAHFEEPFCCALPRGTQCRFQLWPTSWEVDFVGAHYCAADELAIYLPKPQRWAQLSLDWLAGPTSRYGSHNCDPALFRKK